MSRRNHSVAKSRSKRSGGRQFIEHLEPRQLLTAVSPFINVETVTQRTVGFIPPDPHLAAGGDFEVATVNGRVQAFDRLGNSVLSQNLPTFFGGGGFVFDPKVQYDEMSGRFVVVAFDQSDPDNTNTGDSARIWLAVSQSSDPRRGPMGTAGWNIFSFAADQTIGGTHCWVDYPGLAVDDEAIYVTANCFGFNNGGFAGSRLFIFDKTKAYANQNPFSSIQNPCGSLGIGQGFTMQPAQAYGATPGSVGTWLIFWNNSNLFGDEFVDVLRVDNPLSGPSFATNSINVGNVGGGWPAAAPWDPPVMTQLGSSTGLNAGDSRFMDVKWRDNELWAVAATEWGGQSSIVWFRIGTTNPNNPTLLDKGRLEGELISPNASVTFPSIAIDAAHNVAIGFAVSSPTMRGSAAYSFSPAGSPIQLNGTATVYATGQAPYVQLDTQSRNRWGDYSGMAVDPNGVFWAFNEFAKTPDSSGDFWSTRLAAFSTTTMVLNTNDAGPGSLRAAILAANSMPGAQTIHFAIPTTDPNFSGGFWTIRPRSALPNLDDGTNIEGPRTAPISGQTFPAIVLDGGLAGAADGLHITGNNLTVRNLTVQRFSDDGIEIAGGRNVTIRGSQIGTNSNGTIAFANGGQGIALTSNAFNCTIGVPGDGNLVSGNNGRGVVVTGSSLNTIQSNNIGTSANGRSALPNHGGGVIVTGNSALNWIGRGNIVPGSGNLISGNDMFGVRMEQGATGNVLTGNSIGIDATGLALGNARNGVELDLEAHGNRIGWGGEYGGNIISGNAQNGVFIYNAYGNTVEANNIGGSPNFFVRRPNGASGIYIGLGAHDNVIGGPNSINANTIVANAADGVTIFGGGADHNVLQGNYIGLIRGSLTPAFGNLGHGIAINSGQFTTIGGLVAGMGNTIGCNGGDGIYIVEGDGSFIQGNSIGVAPGLLSTFGNSGNGIRLASNSIRIGDLAANRILNNLLAGVAVVGGRRNTIRGNSIDTNGGLGIDLDPIGPTANDAGDPDGGANDLQNYPTPTLASSVGASTRVVGSLNSTPGTSFIIDAYMSPAPDASGSGEGATWLGSFNILTDAAGNAGFDTYISAPSIAGQFLSLTATAPDGSTSEFSSGIEIYNGNFIQLDHGWATIDGLWANPLRYIRFRFNRRLGRGIAGNNLMLVDGTTGERIPTDGVKAGYDDKTSTVTFDLTGLSLPTSIYEARIPARFVEDQHGNKMPEDAIFRFALVNGTRKEDRFSISGSPDTSIVLVKGGDRTMELNVKDLDQVVISGYEGNDTFDVAGLPPSGSPGARGLHYEVTLFGGSGDDALSADWPLPAPIHFSGGDGNDQNTIGGSLGPDFIMLNGDGLSDDRPEGLPGQPLTFDQLENLNLKSGAGADQITIDSPPMGLGVFVDAGEDNDTLSIHGLLSKPIRLDGGAGDDTVDADSTVQGELNFTDPAGNDTLRYTGSDDKDSIAMGDGSVRPAGAALNFQNTELIIVAAGGGDDSIQVLSTLSAVQTNIDLGEGDDAIQFGNNGSMAAILGGVSLDGGPGLDTLNFDDTAGTGERSFMIFDQQMTRNDSTTFSFTGIEDEVLNTGDAASTFLSPQPFPPDPTAFTINAGAGNDVLRLGAPGAITFNAGGGQNTLELGGRQPFEFTSDLGAISDNLALVVSGDAALGGVQHLGSITVKDGGRLSLKPGGEAFVYTGALSIEGAGRFDLGDGAMALRTSPNQRPAALALMGLYIRSANASPARWDAPGLISGLNRYTSLRGLAAILNDRNGKPILNELSGQPVLLGDILVKLALNGDTNLDGRINADDYFRIDSGFLNRPSPPSYGDGDFNYDGKINADDYFRIDSAFLGQRDLLFGNEPEGDEPQAPLAAVASASPVRRSRSEPVAHGLHSILKNGPRRRARHASPFAI